MFTTHDTQSEMTGAFRSTQGALRHCAKLLSTGTGSIGRLSEIALGSSARPSSGAVMCNVGLTDDRISRSLRTLTITPSVKAS